MESGEACYCCIGAVAFLASDEAGFITGETLVVNGEAWMD